MQIQILIQFRTSQGCFKSENIIKFIFRLWKFRLYWYKMWVLLNRLFQQTFILLLVKKALICCSLVINCSFGICFALGFVLFHLIKFAAAAGISQRDISVTIASFPICRSCHIYLSRFIIMLLFNAANIWTSVFVKLI